MSMFSETLCMQCLLFYHRHYSIAILESTMVLALQNIHLYVHQLAVICAVVACSVLAGCCSV